MIPEGTDGYTGPQLNYTYDDRTDVLTIEGTRYSGELFREWSRNGMPTGSLFELTRSAEGSFSVKRVWAPERKEPA